MDLVHTPDTTDGEPQNVLDTTDGEIYFFKALMRARPVGVNRYFHVMAMQSFIEKGIKQNVSIDEIWAKLESCYNLEALEVLEAEYESNGNQSSSSTPQPTGSPKPGDNLAVHPFFRTEFSLPSDSFIDASLAERRVRATASPSPPVSPSPARSPAESHGPAKRGRKRKPSSEPSKELSKEPSKADLAGLVSGDSDSSDLTQQSGDEDGSHDQAQTPSEKRAASVVSGTEGSDNIDEEDEEKGEDETTTKPRRGRKPGRGRGRGSRKRKR